MVQYGKTIGVRRIFPLAILLCLASCGGPLGKPINAKMSDLMPLAVGSEWKYSQKGGTSRQPDRSRRVVSKTTFNGKPAFELEDKDEDGQNSARYIYRLNDDGLFLHQFDGYMRKDAENREIQAPLKSGSSWQVEIPVFSGGHAGKEQWNYSIRGMEKVTVPAGTFQAVRIDCVNSFLDEASQLFYRRAWYAPKVGMIKLLMGNSPELKDSTMELKSYKLAN